LPELDPVEGGPPVLDPTTSTNSTPFQCRFWTWSRENPNDSPDPRLKFWS
jgi:hypothetical protein